MNGRVVRTVSSKAKRSVGIRYQVPGLAVGKGRKEK